MAVIFGALGCAGENRPPAGLEVRDSAGVEIATIRLSPTDVPRWQVSERPDVAIATNPDSARGPVIGVVGPVRWLSDGRVLIADLSANTLYLYDAAGAFLRSFGRSGRGPGEFGSIITVSVSPFDSIYVDERGRTSVLHPTVGFVRLVVQPEANPEAWAHQVWSFGADRLVALRLAIGPLPTLTGDEVVPWRMLARLALSDGNGTPIAASPPFDGQYSALFGRGDGPAGFSNVPFVAIGPDEVVYGSGQAYSLTVLDSTFQITREIRWPANREPLTDAMVDSAKSQVHSAFPPGYPADRRELVVRQMFAKSVLPADRPAIGSTLIDDQRRIWVGRFEPFLPRAEPLASDQWFIHDRSGQPLGRLILPRGARLEAVRGARVLVVVTDSLDTQSVAAFRLTP